MTINLVQDALVVRSAQGPDLVLFSEFVRPINIVLSGLPDRRRVGGGLGVLLLHFFSSMPRKFAAFRMMEGGGVGEVALHPWCCLSTVFKLKKIDPAAYLRITNNP